MSNTEATPRPAPLAAPQPHRAPGLPLGLKVGVLLGALAGLAMSVHFQNFIVRDIYGDADKVINYMILVFYGHLDADGYAGVVLSVIGFAILGGMVGNTISKYRAIFAPQ